MKKIYIGVDRVIKAPDGSCCAFGFIPFASAMLGASKPYPVLVRANTFGPGPLPPGWMRVWAPPNTAIVGQTVSGNVHVGGGAGMRQSDLDQALSLPGSILYFLCGSSSGWGPGYYLYNPVQLFTTNTKGIRQGAGRYAPSSPSDVADWQFVTSQFPAYMASKPANPELQHYLYVDPTSCLSSTLASSAGPSTATTMSPLLLVAAALAAGYYFLG